MQAAAAATPTYTKDVAPIMIAQAYWNGRGANDATSQANAALKAVNDLDNAARAKNDQSLLDAQAAMGRTCGACHTPHRERMPDGHFEIK